MNLVFFYSSLGIYVLAAAGYIAFLVKPQLQWSAAVSRWMTLAGFILQILYFSFRWAESGHIPMTSFFEAINFFGMGIVFVFLIMEFRFKIAALGAFMLPLIITLMVPSVLVSGDIGELNPMLKSGWLGIHTVLTVLGDAAFAFAFIVSIMYLVQEHQLKSKNLGAIFHRLPSLDTMDTLGYRGLTFGWPLYTLGMITGSIWANSAWGSYWNWDPKLTWSLFTWLIYLVLLHLRTIGWRGRKMAVLAIVSFLFVLVSFFVVGRVHTGKHSF